MILDKAVDTLRSVLGGEQEDEEQEEEEGEQEEEEQEQEEEGEHACWSRLGSWR